jgi:RNA-directed DNA polymerase
MGRDKRRFKPPGGPPHPKALARRRELRSREKGTSRSGRAQWPRTLRPSEKGSQMTLLEDVVGHLQVAAQRVCHRRGGRHSAAGVDGITPAQFAQQSPLELRQMAGELAARRYTPAGLRRVAVPKAGGRRRWLSIPTVRDRIVETATANTLVPILEPSLSPRSLAYRPRRGCHAALNAVQRELRAGVCWVIQGDVVGCFDSIDPRRLLPQLRERLPDRSIGWLLSRLILQRGADVAPGLGIPQGGPLSPLLANLYLDRADQRLRVAGAAHVRYSDNLLLLSRSRPGLGEAVREAYGAAAGLGLLLQWGAAVHVTATAGTPFLGFEVRAGSIVPLTGRVQSFQKRVMRILASLQCRVGAGETIDRLNTHARAWLAYFGQAGHGTWVEELDRFVSLAVGRRLAQRGVASRLTGSRLALELLGLRLLADLMPRTSAAPVADITN